MKLPNDWEAFLNTDPSKFYNELELFLSQFDTTTPHKSKIFAVFHKLPPNKVTAVLLGEDPYPRINSACGIAFLDKEITTWDSKARGNSMKHIHKALLIKQGLANYSTPLEACREASKAANFPEPEELFEYWLSQGVLLLNTSLTFSSSADKKKHFAFWRPFMINLLTRIEREQQPHYILWGKKAQAWSDEIKVSDTSRIIAQGHPTYQHHFLKKNAPEWSPFTEIEEITQISFSKS